MSKIDRRSALGIELAAASAAMMKPAAAQTTSYKDTTPWPGVVVRAYDGETPSIIPCFKTLSMRDIIMQPGSKTMGPPMMNAMICHVPKGELRIEQEGKTFTAKKNFVWTCNKDTKEQAYNDGEFLLAASMTWNFRAPFGWMVSRQIRLGQLRERHTADAAGRSGSSTAALRQMSCQW